MPNRMLTKDELEKADALLHSIRKQLDTLSGGDRELLFAYRRKVQKELMHDERGKPGQRKRLKACKRAEQGGRCAACQEPLPDSDYDLDRFNAVDGYTAENTRLLCRPCHVADQKAKGYR